MKKELTQSAEQTLIFFEEFVRKAETVEFIESYRKYLNLPSNGIPFTKIDRKELTEEPLNMFLYIPQRIRSSFPDETRDKPIRVINTCIVFVKQQGVESMYINALLTLYLYFNKTISVTLDKMFNTRDDLLRLEHLPSELADYSKEDDFLLKCAYEHFEEVAKKYPVALYINPDASQRQIQDFLSKNWGYVEMHQKAGAGKITGPKKKSKGKQERKDFIYKNRALPRKEIMQMANRKFPDLEPIDYGNVGKIISLEKLRREKK